MAEYWDVVVIGAGPAGLTAAQVSGAHDLSCLCIDRLGPGGELINLGLLHDCPDLPPDTTGADLVARLTDAATAVGVELAFGEVRELRQSGEHWRIATEGESYQARAVIIATGLAPGKLSVPEEERFAGLGLSHCASCDGPLYGGEDVIVAGAGEWAIQDAIDLAGLARHVTLIGPDEAERPSPERVAGLAGLANVTVIPGRIVALHGVDGVDAVVVERDAVQERHSARAVFVHCNREPALEFADGLLATDAEGRAFVNGDLCASQKRAYAAGDVRAGAPQRIASAIKDGQRAGIAVARLLGTRDGGQQGGR